MIRGEMPCVGTIRIDPDGEQLQPFVRPLVDEVVNLETALAVYHYRGGDMRYMNEGVVAAVEGAMDIIPPHRGGTAAALCEAAGEFDAAHAQDDERARLRELCDQTELLLDAGDLHEAWRLNANARDLSWRVYGAAAIGLKPSGDRCAR